MYEEIRVEQKFTNNDEPINHPQNCEATRMSSYARSLNEFTFRNDSSLKSSTRSVTTMAKGDR